MRPFIALTDKAWFGYLSSAAQDGIVDEVNFWSPKSTFTRQSMALGMTVPSFHRSDVETALPGASRDP